MLRLQKIVKNYPVANAEVNALKSVDLSFRANEFVAILGPSGCGKTTMLNIIGGLDKYTSGDLFINGTSTREYKDRDWDIYRNRSIGFIFQSYNLIPHQTVLGNVELALTIAGLSKKERIEKAKHALDRVGLSDQYYKKPNQLSGGQCQRVAIARSLVNDPEILLADEPTGALDSTTSIQIMELVKEIAKERLVIMVTHNNNLAEEYATRIVNLLDGEVVGDSNPFSEQDEINEVKSRQEEIVELNKNKKAKAKMSVWTAFMLSLRNLLSKKGRTVMIGFAGSIGIIGVSLVLAVTSGVNGYIAGMQDDMLSGNPVTITEETFDLSSFSFPAGTQREIRDVISGEVNINQMLSSIIDRFSMGESMFARNDITQELIDYILTMPEEAYASISLGFGLDVTNNIYTDFQEAEDHALFPSGRPVTELSLSVLKNVYTSILKGTEFGQYASFITSLSDVLSQASPDVDYLLTQYDILEGKIALEANELMLVVNSDTEVTDLVLAQLGYYTQDEFINIAFAATDDPLHNPDLDVESFTYEQLMEKKFYYYENDDVYTDRTALPPNIIPPSTIETLLFGYNAYGDSFTPTQRNNALEMNVVGILRPKSTISYGSLEAGFFYTDAFTQKFIEDNIESELAKYIDTLVDGEGNKTGVMNSGEATLEGTTIRSGIFYPYTYTFDEETRTGRGFVSGGSSIDMSSLVGLITGGMGGGGGGGSMFGDAVSYSLSLRNVGGNALANSIAIHPTSFDTKDQVTGHLDAWNDSVGEPGYETRTKIVYSDPIGLIINLVNNLINIVSSALVAFTAVSLVVSTVMIGIITYVSVVERIKEIGVIRSLGGRKRDVSNLFIAETGIIGFVAGVIGIVVTYILQLVLNAIVGFYTGVFTIAALPFWLALVMIGVSIVLTLISGVIPARSAAKKDPVVALRTE